MNAEKTEVSEIPPSAQSLDDITDQLNGELLSTICTLGGISEDRDSIRRPLAKKIWRFQRKLALGPIENPDPQRKDFENLHSAVRRTLAVLSRLKDQNKAQIDYEIQYRPPFNNRFNFPQQEDYWNANGNSINRAENLLKMISWAAERVSKGIDEDLSFGRRTQNTYLDYFILDLAYDFQEWTGKSALSQCYYSAELDGYTGQFFDFICIILDSFMDRSYHSKVALGKRIVRLLSVKKN